MEMATRDDVIEEVYKHRDELARENGYDVRRLVEALKRREAERATRRAEATKRLNEVASDAGTARV
jgi:hypothetical protein